MSLGYVHRLFATVGRLRVDWLLSSSFKKILISL